MNPAPPVWVKSHDDSTQPSDTGTPAVPSGPPPRRAEALPRTTGTQPQEAPVNTQTTDTTLTWRDYTDHDAYQARIAADLAAETDVTPTGP